MIATTSFPVKMKNEADTFITEFTSISMNINEKKNETLCFELRL